MKAKTSRNRGGIDTVTQIHDRTASWLGIGTSVLNLVGFN